MTTYDYRAKNREGVTREGVIEADELREAVKRLQDQDLVIIKIKEKNALPEAESKKGSWREKLAVVLHTPLKAPFIKAKLGNRDLRNLSFHLRSIINAGMPLLVGLHLLEKEAENTLLQKKIAGAARLVENGHSLAHSFGSQEGYFPPFFVNMIEAGESGGALEEVAERLALHYEKQHDLQQKVREATAYPKFILVIIMAVSIFLLAVVLPSFTGIFNSTGVELPFLTRIFITTGSFCASYWQVLAVLAAASFLCYRFWAGTKRGKDCLDSTKLILPVVGNVYRKVICARFCRTLSTMLGCGVNIISSLELSGKTVDNSVFRRNIEGATMGIVRGQTLLQALSKSGLFPPLVLGMVHVGEQTGNLQEMIGKTADFFETEVDYAMRKMGSILEPFLIVSMALVVGSIVLSIMLPLFQVFSTI